MSVSERTRFIRNLAAAFLSSEWAITAMTSAAARATGKRLSWVASLAKRALAKFPTRPAYQSLLTFIDGDPAVDRVRRSEEHVGRYPISTVFAPPVLAALPLPAFSTSTALAEWLGLAHGRLDWLADSCGRNCLHPSGPLRTYRYRWVPKPGRRWRLLEIPTSLLRQAQRKLLDDLLCLVPTHTAVHGFRRGYSAVTNAAAHCGKEVIFSFDLADFFQSIPSSRVFALFTTLGYPRSVARLLAGLCTTRIPLDVWNARPNPAFDGSDHATWQRFNSRHLPQGAPTSPVIANLIAFRFDCRLAGLAADLGATYTRYADDLTFSGGPDLARGSKRLAHLVAVIALEEGFKLNYRKTRVQRRGGRQTVTGVVVNTRPNVPRDEFDWLKAILTNCLRHGPAEQNREKHADFRAFLLGKVAHIAAVNPNRGRKLQALFNRIAWPSA